MFYAQGPKFWRCLSWHSFPCHHGIPSDLNLSAVRGVERARLPIIIHSTLLLLDQSHTAHGEQTLRPIGLYSRWERAMRQATEGTNGFGMDPWRCALQVVDSQAMTETLSDREWLSCRELKLNSRRSMMASSLSWTKNLIPSARRITGAEGHQQRTPKRSSKACDVAKNDTNFAKQSGVSKNTRHNVK